MSRLKMSRGLRKYVRLQKARIRREVLDAREQEKLIGKLYEKVLPKDQLVKMQKENENN